MIIQFEHFVDLKKHIDHLNKVKLLWNLNKTKNYKTQNIERNLEKLNFQLKFCDIKCSHGDNSLIHHGITIGFSIL